MSLKHSPSVVTDGLVMYYDMSNTQKSWKGRPVTNQFTLPTAAVNGFGVQNSTFTRIYSGTYGNYTLQISDYVWQYNINGGDCPYHGWDIPTTAGDVVTFSFDYYISPTTVGYPSTNYLANFENAGSGVSGSVADPTPSIIGVWKRAYITSTATATGNSRCLMYPGACGAQLATGTGFILYKNPQVEFNAPGGIPTPFVAGTRYANNNLESTPNYPTWNQSAASASGGTLTFTSGSYTNKGTWDLYKTYSGLSTGTNYTWSALVKKGTATNLIVTMNNTQAWDTGPAEVFSEFSSTEWKRVSITGTTSFGSFNIHLGSSYNTGFRDTVQTGGTILIQDVRLQLTSSQTAIKDLTDQNTIAATSLTYASDGTFSFNGSNSLTFANPLLAQSNAGQEWSVISWVNINTTANQLLLTGINNGLYLTTGSNTTLLYLNSGANDYYTYGTAVGGAGWCQVAYRFKNSTGERTIYKNGVNITTSGPNNTSTPAGNSGTFTLGSGTNGSIGATMIYNRYITDAELMQNFNALRGRYGI